MDKVQKLIAFVATGSAVTALPEAKELVSVAQDIDINYIDVVRLFSVGISCGILFSFLMFVFSILLNAFFDIIRK